MSKTLFLMPVLLSTLLLSACNALRVYTIDLPQGNPITQEMSAKLKIGMTPAQVRYVLGSPMITDSLNTQRWDYVYQLRAGTYAQEAGIHDIKGQHLILSFDGGKLSKITGQETLPTQSPVTILSKDGGLRAEPL